MIFKSKPLFAIFSLLLLSMKVWAEDLTELLFLQGNEAFAKQDYPKAIQRYQQIIQQNENSSSLHFNLGNTYFQVKQFGQAALHYEKSLAIKPNNKDAKVNLLLAKKAAGLDIEKPTLKENFIHALSISSWFFLVSLALWALLIGWIVHRFFTIRPILLKIVTPPLFLTLFLASAAILLSHSQSTRALAIIDETALRIAPANSSEATLYLSQAEEVIVLKTYENFLLCETKSGIRGWANAQNIGKIWD
jgi:tetratricopeptide (TPR) repeat protein